jgi:T-complex protein 1 subunit beta
MDTDKIKIFGARVKVDGTGKLAELERAERVSNQISFSRA